MTKHTGLARYMNRWEGDPGVHHRFAQHFRARAYALLVQAKHQTQNKANISADGLAFVTNHYEFLRREALAELAEAKKANKGWNFSIQSKAAQRVHRARLNLMGLRAFHRANLALIDAIERKHSQ